MQIHRFDAESSAPAGEGAGAVRHGPVTAAGARVQVHAYHLPAGAVLDRAPAPVRVLLCVVAGAGRVRGGDGVERSVAAGWAACWEAGEPQWCSSAGGLTALGIEGGFEVLARSLLQEITVVEYDPEWPAWFEELRAYVWPAVEDLAVRIDHVGSTSVPGLAAKPVIDMDVVLPSDALVRTATERLGAIGYEWRGDLGVTGRQAYRPPGGADLPAHHLYVVVEDSRAHLDHWLLRDLLRADADARRRYGDLKRRNAELAQGDIDAYVRAKAAFVAGLLTRARAERGLEPVDYWLPDEDPAPE